MDWVERPALPGRATVEAGEFLTSVAAGSDHPTMGDPNLGSLWVTTIADDL
ncbi:hypothetical protein [Micromonospora echinaurantiaca]|uniref:hypothetical protein n=1 Tax=Micromonospora echinaurantiaca TaxID=47857 RepID=UPI00378F1C60